MQEYALVTQGTMGDISPILSLANVIRELKPQSKITILANENWKELSKYYGYDFVAICPEDPKQDTRSRVSFLKFNVREAFRNSYNALTEMVRRNNRLHVFSILAMRGVDLAKCHLDFRSTKLCLQPYTLFSSQLPSYPLSALRFPQLDIWLKMDISAAAMRYKMNSGVYFKVCQEFYQEYKGPRFTSLHDASHVHDEIICLFPEWYSGIPDDWPSTVKFFGFPPPFDQRDIEPELKSFLAENKDPLVFSPGTGIKGNQSIFGAINIVCQQGSIPAILITSNTSFDLKQIDGKRERLFVTKSVNLDKLLPHARMFVHHGGIGSVANGVRAGIPQIIRPERFDQPDNARRVKRLKLGTYIEKSRFNAGNLDSAIKCCGRNNFLPNLEPARSETLLRDRLFKDKVRNCLE